MTPEPPTCATPDPPTPAPRVPAVRVPEAREPGNGPGVPEVAAAGVRRGVPVAGVGGGDVPAHPEEVSITVCPDGPLLVRGPVELLSTEGTPLPLDRRTLALCRCGRTGRAPFCDGSHKHRPRDRRAEGSPPT